VLSEMVNEPRVLYGGGWPEMRMARATEEAAKKTPGAALAHVLGWLGCVDVFCSYSAAVAAVLRAGDMHVTGPLLVSGKQRLGNKGGPPLTQF
jgi:hypothetical protein